MSTTSEARVREILTRSPVIAVLGIHIDPDKPAHYVPEYLHQSGYRVIGVNPRFAGEIIFGERVRATLAEIGEAIELRTASGAAARPAVAGLAIDLVDVFRRPEQIPEHEADLLAMRPLPKVVWFQLGIRNDEVAARLAARGIEVVQDRCTLADHRRLGLGAPTRSPLP